MSCFLVLRVRTRFRRYRGRQVQFSCFARPDSFSTVPRTSCPVLKFCAPGLYFGSAEGVGSRFQVLRPRTRYRRYRGRRVPFLSFARPDSFSAVPRVSSPIFMFCTPGPISTIPRALGPIFMFCALGLIFCRTDGVHSCFHVLRAQTWFGGVEGVMSRFHILRNWIRFRWYRGRQLPFSCFARSDSFSAVPRASAHVFMFCALGIVFGCTEGIVSRFQVLRAPTHFGRYRRHWVPFSCFVLPDLFSAVPRRRLPFSSFARPESLSAVPSASCTVLMNFVPELIFGGTESVVSRLHVLRARNRLRRYLERRVPFSSFARPDSFSVVKVSGTAFMCPDTFRWYVGRWAEFSSFARPDSFSAVPRESALVFMF
jgi:hypothetical protein